MSSRSVLTLAIGNPVYVGMAWTLARSFYLWNRGSDIRFAVATDQVLSLPRDLKEVDVLRIRPGQYGFSFSPKLHLDKLAPADETLFVDADCLCVAPLEPVFDAFRGHDVSVVGRIEETGELFGDIAHRCRAVGVPWTVRFCGGIYFLRRGDACTKVFDSARRLESKYEELGLVPLRGVANEEPLIGLGMALAKQEPIPEDGCIKAEPMFFSGPVQIDVFRGFARLSNTNGEKVLPEWKMPEEARPRLVHFNAAFAERPPYTAEAKRLELVLERGWRLYFATMLVQLTIWLPYSLATGIKRGLRPVYHMFFGPRRIKPSTRVVSQRPSSS